MNAVGQERQAVVWRLDRAQFDEHALEGFVRRVTKAEEIDVPRRSDRLGEPQQEQCGALEDESIRELGPRQAIQQAFAAESGERQLVLDAQLAASLDEARLHRRDDAPGTAALHMTTVSR